MEIFFLFIIVVLITGILFNLKQNVKIKRENISIEELINAMQKEYGKEYTIKKKFGNKLWMQKGLIAISCVLKNKRASNSIDLQYESRFSILFHIIPTAYAVWSGKKELKNIKSFIEKSNYLQSNNHNNMLRYDNNAKSFFKTISENAINNSKYSNDLLDKKLFSGGDGSSEHDAVIINTTNTADGIDAEYIFIQSKFGMRGVNWKLERQKLTGNNSKHYDVMVIKLLDGSTKEIYFDITSFFGK